MQSAFDKRKEELNEFNNALEKLKIRKKEESQKLEIPDNLMIKCSKCNRMIDTDTFLKNLSVC